MSLFIGLVLIIGGVVLAVWYGAHRTKRAFERQNEIVPGVRSRAPGEWAGAHSPEALLHRRLRAAVLAARAQPGGEGAVAAIQQGALETDDQLIAAAALPASQREAAIRAVEPSVIALEEAVARLAGSRTANGARAVNDAVADAEQRIDAIGAARAEIEQADTSPSIADLLATQPEQQPAQTQPPEHRRPS